MSITEKLLEWYETGEVGISSRTIAEYLGRGRIYRYPWPPADPDDMNRCLKLLQAVPEFRLLLPKMAEVSKEWAALMARWDEVERSQLDEIGIDWKKARSAPKTYALMREIYASASKVTP